MENIEATSTEQEAGAELAEDEKERIKAVVDVFMRLSIACKSRSLYPGDHPAALEAAQLLHAVLTDSSKKVPDMTVHVGKDSLFYEKWSIGKRIESLNRLALRIRSLNIQEITFLPGTTLEEIETLVGLLVSDVEEVECEGGVETLLFAKGVQHIGVLESTATKAEDETIDEDDRVMEMGEKETTALLDALMAGFVDRVKDLLELMLNPEELARTFLKIPAREKRPLSKEELADTIFQFLSNASSFIEQKYPDSKSTYYRSMAEAFLFLQIDLRNLLLKRQILPGISEEPACISILSQFTAQELADILGDFLPVVPELVPKTRSLLKVIGLDSQDVERAINILKDKLIESGEVAPSLISSLEPGPRIESTEQQAIHRLPTFEEISDISNEYQPEEIEEIQRISEIDLDREKLIDTTPMLLDLLDQGAKLGNLGKAVELLQEYFWDLIESKQLGQAAVVLERSESILKSGDPAYEPFRADLALLVEEATNPAVIHRIMQFAYSMRDDPQTLEGFTRYMSDLGEKGIDAMIEVLGTEEDMSLRKYIYDVLAEVSRDHLHLLGAYVNDPRWYLVRNIISIMARFHSTDILPYLRRTFDHPNPKVRAETIRALGFTGGYEACEMLIRGLDNPDEQTRILCIRWLGRLGEARAVGRLIAMLENRERGGEELQVKKEIIVSLGEIETPDTYETLKKYSHHKKMLNRAEWQEINTAALEALDNLVRKFPHLGRKV